MHSAFIPSTFLNPLSSPHNPCRAIQPSRITRSKSSRTILSATSSPSPKTIHPTPTKPSLSSCFGRGEQFPRRTVGLYELEREGINPSKLIDQSKSNPNIFFVYAGFVVAFFLIVPPAFFHISVEWPLAATIAVLLSAWAVDVLALNSVFGRAISISMNDSTRIAHHEAGHFLVGYLLGFRIDQYCIPTPSAILDDKVGALGVQYGNSPASGDPHSVSAVGMAGIAAEVLKYGMSEGGTEDMADVSRSIRACNGGNQVLPDVKKRIMRWGMIESVTLLKQHSEALDALREAMIAGLSIEDCIAVIENNVNRDELAEKKSVYAAS